MKFDDYYKLLLRVKALMDEVEGFEDPYLSFRFDSARAKVNSASIEDLMRLERMLSGMVLSRRASPKTKIREPNWPEFPKEPSVCFGRSIPSGKEIRIPLDSLAKHTLVAGKSGEGKTTFIFYVIDQTGVPILYKCHKNEGRRLLNLYDDVLVTPLNRIPENLLKAPDGSRSYHSSLANELGKLASLRPESVRRVLKAIQQMDQSSKGDREPPSLMDLVTVIRYAFGKRKVPALANAAAALETMFEELSPLSEIRRCPSAEALAKFRIHVQEYAGFPPSIQKCVAAISLLRYQSRSYSNPDVSGLTSLYVSDEAALEFAKELQGASDISSPKRMITQSRSSGRGIIAGIQNIDMVDSTLINNCDNFVFMGARDPANLKMACDLLRMPYSRIGELDTLVPGEFYLQSSICDEPIRCRFPNFDMGPYLSDSEVERKQKKAWEELDRQTTYSPNPEIELVDLGVILNGYESAPKDDENKSKGQVLEDVPPFVADWYCLLDDIARFPYFGVVERCGSVGYSSTKIGRVKRELRKHGLIEPKRRRNPKGGRPREIMSITPRGEAFLAKYAPRK